MTLAGTVLSKQVATSVKANRRDQQDLYYEPTYLDRLSRMEARLKNSVRQTARNVQDATNKRIDNIRRAVGRSQSLARNCLLYTSPSPRDRG